LFFTTKQVRFMTVMESNDDQEFRDIPLKALIVDSDSKRYLQSNFLN
jgi:hypothetical protein